MTMNITALRRAGHADQAIVDFLQLRQLRLIPGVVSRQQLEMLWGVTQPQVCRRMQALHALGAFTVRPTNRAGYTVCSEPPATVRSRPRPVDTAAARIRWEAMRQHWRKGVAA